MMNNRVELDLYSERILLSGNDDMNMKNKINNLVHRTELKKILIKEYNFLPTESDVTIMLVIDLLNWKSIAVDLNMSYKYITGTIKRSIYEKLGVDTDMGVSRSVHKILLSGKKYD